MKKIYILVFIFVSVVLNAQDSANQNKELKKDKIIQTKEVELKEERKANIKKEVEKLRKLLMAEQNQK